jgi:holliday junction DNA helicase RuvB
MNVKEPITTPVSTGDDQVFDLALRPTRFDEYIGQEKIKDNLKIILGAAKKRNDPAEHLLLHGPSG